MRCSGWIRCRCSTFMPFKELIQKPIQAVYSVQLVRVCTFLLKLVLYALTEFASVAIKIFQSVHETIQFISLPPIG